GRAPLGELMRGLLRECDAIVCVMALGILVRTLAPLLVSKHSDPAVVCVDDAGRFVISVASGHGGANRLAELLAHKLGAVPVVTTSTASQGLECAEEIAERNSLLLEGDARHVNSAIANRRRVVVFSDMRVSTRLEVYPLEMMGRVECDAGIVVSSRLLELPRGWVVMRPLSLVAGVGSRRGVSAQRVLAALSVCLERARLSSLSLRGIFTIPHKAGERGIREAAERLGVELGVVETERVREVEHRFRCSEFVRRASGVGAVAEPCAYIASGGGRVLGVFSGGGVRVAVAEQTFIF
ncbi:MAG: cobalamin biosynthesis protein CbiG, partial [Euryarchaeota archaeon]|nr:cobalamin biosynthesis protein CbiG [Euryarchaeota archaeon]